MSDIQISNSTVLDGAACAPVPRGLTLSARLAAAVSSASVRSISAQAFALIDQGCLSASTFATTALLAHTAGFAVEPACKGAPGDAPGIGRHKAECVDGDGVQPL